jgi:hypothetical protein
VNKRIRELAEQVGFGWDDKYHWYVGGHQMEKFAELLIQECVQCINNRTEDWNAKLLWTFDDGTYMDVNVDSVLKDHFDGVVD